MQNHKLKFHSCCFFKFSNFCKISRAPAITLHSDNKFPSCCFFLQISFVLLEFPSHFPQNLFPSNFLHFAKISFQKEISFKVEALVHAPLKTFKIRNRPCPYVTNEIKELMKSRSLRAGSIIWGRRGWEKLGGEGEGARKNGRGERKIEPARKPA